jgi:predicted AlkP superfamily pyrophosphatase or phosphodiesterase
MAGISERGLDDVTDIVVVSDHGMTDVIGVISFDGLEIARPATLKNNHAFVLVYPHNNADAVEIKEAMDLQSTGKNYTVYLKDEIPARFHYQHNVFIPEILLLADVGWAFGDGPALGGMHG